MKRIGKFLAIMVLVLSCVATVKVNCKAEAISYELYSKYENEINILKSISKDQNLNNYINAHKPGYASINSESGCENIEDKIKHNLNVLGYTADAYSFKVEFVKNKHGINKEIVYLSTTNVSGLNKGADITVIKYNYILNEPVSQFEISYSSKVKEVKNECGEQFNVINPGNEFINIDIPEEKHTVIILDNEGNEYLRFSVETGNFCNEFKNPDYVNPKEEYVYKLLGYKIVGYEDYGILNKLDHLIIFDDITLQAVYEEKIITGDPSELILLYEKAKSLDKENYTEESYAKLYEVIEIVGEFLNNINDKTASMIYEKYNLLDEAVNKLEIIEAPVVVSDPEMLVNLYKYALSLDKSKYTEISYAPLEVTLKDVKAFLNDYEHMTNELIAEKYSNLNSVINNLRKKADKLVETAIESKTDECIINDSNKETKADMVKEVKLSANIINITKLSENVKKYNNVKIKNTKDEKDEKDESYYKLLSTNKDIDEAANNSNLLIKMFSIIPIIGLLVLIIFLKRRNNE